MISEKVRFTAVAAGSANLSQIGGLPGGFHMRGNGLGHESGARDTSQKRTTRPLRINVLRLYIDPTQEA